ncbi:MAG TPA: hypothetical protein VFM42_06475, partial [Sphingomicrobium sp.]|nr:hypothetical protein [Sphingomicrobium sp.]
MRFIARAGWQAIEPFATADEWLASSGRAPLTTANGSAFIRSPRVQFVHRLLIALLLCFPASAAFAKPALIPLPASVDWHDGNVP